MQTMTEKRRHARLGIKFPLRYRPVNTTPPKFCSAQVKDFSESGLCFQCQHFIPHQAPIFLEFHLPSHPKPIRLASKIIRSRQERMGNSYEIAVRFPELLSSEKECLHRLIREKGCA